MGWRSCWGDWSWHQSRGQHFGVSCQDSVNIVCEAMVAYKSLLTSSCKRIMWETCENHHTTLWKFSEIFIQYRAMKHVFSPAWSLTPSHRWAGISEDMCLHKRLGQGGLGDAKQQWEGDYGCRYLEPSGSVSRNGGRGGCWLHIVWSWVCPCTGLWWWCCCHWQCMPQFVAFTLPFCTKVLSLYKILCLLSHMVCTQVRTTLRSSRSQPQFTSTGPRRHWQAVASTLHWRMCFPRRHHYHVSFDSWNKSIKLELKLVTKSWDSSPRVPCVHGCKVLAASRMLHCVWRIAYLKEANVPVLQKASHAKNESLVCENLPMFCFSLFRNLLKPGHGLRSWHLDTQLQPRSMSNFWCWCSHITWCFNRSSFSCF